MKYTLTYTDLQTLVENAVGHSVNTCIFWNNISFTTKAGYYEKANHRLIEWIGKKSTRLRPNKRDNGNVLMVEHIPKLIQHFVKLKKLKSGEYEVIPS